MSNDKYDVIGLMQSGIPYAAISANFLIQQGKDVRFFAYYPVRITYQRYLEKTKENPKFCSDRINDKIYSLEANNHKHLDAVLDFVTNLSQEQILKAKRDFFNSPNLARTSLINNFWLDKIRHVAVEGKKEFPYEEFIKNTAKRLTQEPDPSRIALICDDYHHDGDTLYNSVYDLFSLGYTRIKVDLEMSSTDQTTFEGNYENFKKIYQNKNPRMVGRDILK